MNNWVKQMKRAWLNGRKRRTAAEVAARKRIGLSVETLEGRVVPAVLISGLDTGAGTVSFTGNTAADSLTLIRWETTPGSGNFVLRHNLSGGGLNSAIDLDPNTAGDQTLTLGTGTARNISIDLGGGNDSLTLDDSWAFDHKVTFVGGAGTDTLTGNNQGNAWAITDIAAKAGTLGTGGDNLAWSGIENLVGGVGTADDTLTGENAARTWNLDATQSYTNGTSIITFSEMDVLQGGSGVDTFNIYVGTAVTALKGGAGADVFAFHLSGGSPVTLQGVIDGQTGSDTIDYSGYGAGVGVIASLTADGTDDGFAGTELSIAGSFDSIDALVAAGGGNDVLIGRDADATWSLDGSPDYTSGGRTLAFSGFEQLGGGSGADTFNVSANHAGNLVGSGGADVFNFSAGTLTGDVTGDDGADVFNFSGGAIAGTVTGDAGDDTFNVTAATTLSGGLLGGDDNDTFNVSAAFTGDILGGAGDDSLVLTSTITGSFAGGSGTDTLSFAGYGSARSITLTALGSTDGFNGTEAAIGGGFTDVNALVGSAGADTLAGRDAAATWEVDGSDRYIDAGSGTAAAFSAIENLTGGSAADTFDVTAAHSGVLTGNGGADDFNISAALTGSVAAGAGNDTINVSGSGSVSGAVDGGADDDSLTLSGSATVGSFAGGSGTDTLSFAGYGSARSITLTAADAGGYDGSEAAVGTFTDVDTLTGSANTDTLTGRDAAATWDVDGTNTYTSSGLTLNFSAFENLTGGSAVDTFDVTAAHSGVLTGNGGADDFNISAALTGSVAAGAGNDTINVSGSGSVSGAVDGGADDDTLTLSGSATVGSFAGGGGNDTLSYAGYGNARSVTLTAADAGGYDGSEAAVGTFTDVDTLTGSANTDTLAGRDAAATWDVDGTNTYTSSGLTLNFSAFENLTGGSAADTFNVTAAHAGVLTGNGGADDFNISAALTGSASGGAGDDTFDLSGSGSVSGSLDGGADNDTFTLAGTSTAGSVIGGTGSDTLSYAGRTGSVSVLLTDASADGYSGAGKGLAGGFAGIDALVGSGSTDTLTGMHVNSTWTLGGSMSYSDGTHSLAFSSFETLVGASADDTFKVMNNTAFTGSINGGVGNNTVDYSDDSNTAGINVNFTGTNAGGVSGAFSFAAIANVKGGSGDDTFTFASNAARVTGTLDGQEGSNTLSYSGYSSGVRVSLAANSATGTAGITNFVNVTGGSGNDILIGNAFANVLNGGAGNDIITGGDGDDTINGGAGNDLLIGGNGADTMDGGADDDLMIGGVTTYDANLTALNAIMAEWGRAGVSYATRVGRITGTATGGLNGSIRLTDTQVDDDGAVDSLTGGTGTDWFFFSTGDNVTDRNAGTETQTTVS